MHFWRKSQAFTPSITITSGSPDRLGWSWSRPTSSATTRIAPRSSNTSVKPPVLAQISRQVRPAGSIWAKASSPPINLSAPWLTHGKSVVVSSNTASGVRSYAGFFGGFPKSRTEDDAINARALSREAARPRATSRASARIRSSSSHDTDFCWDFLREPTTPKPQNIGVMRWT